MARPRNAQMEQAVYDCGFRLLLNRGYAATSYQAIADEVGTTRALVQHYLPRKELLLRSFIEKLLAFFDEWVVSERGQIGLWENLALTGQLYFSFLFYDRARDFAREFLSDRNASLAVIDANKAYQHAKTAEEQEDERFLSDELVRIIGGSYEVVFLHLTEGRSLDPFQEALRIVVAYAELCGQEKEAITEQILPLAFNDQEIERALADLYETFAEKRR